MRRGLLFFLILAICAFGISASDASGLRGGVGRGEVIVAAVVSSDSSASATQDGSILREYAGSNGGLNELEKNLTLLPYSYLGHQSVRLLWMHHNPGYSSFPSGTSAFKDSLLWAFPIMVIVFNDGVPDTLTENERGIGSVIQHRHLTGILTPPPNRVSTPIVDVASTSRARNAPTTVRYSVEGDSIQVWFGNYQYVAGKNLSIYFNYGWLSQPNKPTIDRCLHIQAIDTVTRVMDFVRLAGTVDSTVSAELVYWSLDIGPPYNPHVNPPFGNRNSTDVAFVQNQLEQDAYLFWGNRPPLRTTLVYDMSLDDTVQSGTDTDKSIQFYVQRPHYWNNAHTSLEAYSPIERNAAKIYKSIFLPDPAVEDYANDSTHWSAWPYTPQLYSSADSIVWRVRVRDVAIAVRNKLRLDAGSQWILPTPAVTNWLGTEDIPLDGWYGTTLAQQTPLPHASSHGLFSNMTAGIDCTSANLRAHYNCYRIWIDDYGNRLMRLPKGFELYYDKSNTSTQLDTTVWRVSSTTVFYTYEDPTMGVVGRCCYDSFSACADHQTEAECAALQGVWYPFENCFSECVDTAATLDWDTLVVNYWVDGDSSHIRDTAIRAQISGNNRSYGGDSVGVLGGDSSAMAGVYASRVIVWPDPTYLATLNIDSVQSATVTFPYTSGVIPAGVSRDVYVYKITDGSTLYEGTGINQNIPNAMTWTYRRYNTEAWSDTGGDFGATPIDTVSFVSGALSIDITPVIRGIVEGENTAAMLAVTDVEWGDQKYVFAIRLKESRVPQNRPYFTIIATTSE